MKHLKRTGKTAGMLLLFAVAVLLTTYYPLPTRLAFGQTFTGPGTCTAGNCAGTVGTDINKNLGINTSPTSTAKLFVVASSSNSYALTASGTIYILHGNLTFPDGTSQTTAAASVSTLSAANISSGIFGNNTGGGNYTFPAALTVTGTTTMATSFGNVGIGTTAPLRRLAIKGTGTDNGFIEFHNSSNDIPYVGIGYDQTNDGLAVKLNNGSSDFNSTALFVARGTNNGNVGIGTTTPADLLTVNGSSGEVGRFISTNASGVYTTWLNNSTSFGDVGSALQLAGAGFLANDFTVRSNNNLLFISNGGVTNHYMIMDTSGNVGIATTTPSSPLTVAGVIYSSTGGFKFPDGTTQTTASVGGNGTTTAANVAAGTFGANVGNGNYTFPGTLTVNSTANPGLTVGNGTAGYVQIGGSGWYDDGAYLSPMGSARNFYVRSATPISYIYSPAIYLGDGSSSNNVYFRNETLSGTSWGLTSTGILSLTGLTTDSNIKAGPYEIQGYGVNNNWSADNLYYNAGWLYRANGYGAIMHFSSGGITFQTAPNNSSGAGAAATLTAQFTIGNTGAVTVANTLQIGASGGTISNVSNSYYQVNSMGWYVPNSWVIADNVRARGGYYYIGASDYNAIQGTDTYLRLNNANSFTSGVYTPGAFRADGATIFEGGVTMYTSGLNMNSLSITNLATPVNSTDAATKAYVDTAGAVQYKGLTSTSYTANLSGPFGANSDCNSAYAGSHMCTQGELIRTGVTSLGTIPTGYAWIQCDLTHGTVCDGPSYSQSQTTSATCGQWTYGTNTTGYSSPSVGTNGQVYANNCGTSLVIACCK